MLELSSTSHTRRLSNGDVNRLFSIWIVENTFGRLRLRGAMNKFWKILLEGEGVNSCQKN